MKQVLFTVGFLLLVFTGSAQHPVFRWDVKTLTDDSGVDWKGKTPEEQKVMEKFKGRGYLTGLSAFCLLSPEVLYLVCI